MRRQLLLLPLALICLSCPSLATSAPKREAWIPIYISPYYAAADSPTGRPRVAVGRDFDDLLSSTRKADILAARDAIEAAPELITPMTLMVLAIRLYDTGERDEAVFWFYVAKYRAITLFDTAEFPSGIMSDGVRDAITGFIQLSAPYFNGYAFCDFAKQQATVSRALDWVESHPYETIFVPEMASRLKPGDPRENLRISMIGIREKMTKEGVKLAEPATIQAIREARKQNDADAQFCWSAN